MADQEWANLSQERGVMVNRERGVMVSRERPNLSHLGLRISGQITSLFRVNRTSIPEIDDWENEVRRNIMLDFMEDDWNRWVYALSRICYRHRSNRASITFDPLGNFIPIISIWRERLDREIQQGISTNQGVDISQEGNYHQEGNCHECPERMEIDHNHEDEMDTASDDTSGLTLTSLFYDQLNLDPHHQRDLAQLEEQLEIAIENGMELSRVKDRLRAFCRSHAGPNGFYDPRGSFDYLACLWFEVVRGDGVTGRSSRSGIDEPWASVDEAPWPRYNTSS